MVIHCLDCDVFESQAELGWNLLIFEVLIVASVSQGVVKIASELRDIFMVSKGSWGYSYRSTE